MTLKRRGNFNQSEKPFKSAFDSTYNDNRCAWSMFQEIDSWIALKAQNTQRQYTRVFGELCGLLRIERDEQGEETIKALGPEHAIRYTNWARSQPAQPGRSALVGDTVSLNTVRQKIAILHSIFEQLRASGYVQRNIWERPLRELSRHEGNDRRPHELIPFEKVKDLFRLYYTGNRGKRDKALMALLFGGALRCSEATGLRLLDVREGSNGALALQLRNTKKQRAEVQILPAWAAAIVLAYVQIRRIEGARDADPLLTNYLSGKPTNTPLLDRNVRNLFRKYMIAIDLKGDYSPHCARATAITRLLEKGRSHRDVMKFSRHSSPEMVAHYDKMRDTGAQQVAEDLDY